MRRGTHRNRAFDIMGDRFGALIDPSHFGGKSSFSIKRKHGNLSKEVSTADSSSVPATMEQQSPEATGRLLPKKKKGNHKSK